MKRVTSPNIEGESPRPSSIRNRLKSAKKIGLPVLAAVAGATAGHFGLGVSSVKGDRAAYVTNAHFDKDCLAAEKRLNLLGPTAAVVKIGTLSTKDREECGADGIKGRLSSVGAARPLLRTIMDNTVVLPTRHELLSNEHYEYSLASNVKDSFDNDFGIIGGGIMGYVLFSVMSNFVDQIRQNRKPDLTLELPSQQDYAL
jgi:hypothetical protein